MIRKTVKKYISKYFNNIKKTELSDFYSHGLYCEKISGFLFDNILKLNLFDNKEIELYKKYEKLLYIASNIHDFGNFVPGDKPHNKKGAKFILKNKLDCLNDEENLILANLVRFHRGKSPKDKNKMFSLLNNEIKLVVKFYSGILRIADALDYGHCEILESILIKDDAKNKVLTIYLDYDMKNSVGFKLVFKKKKKLLGKILDRKIKLKLIQDD